MLTIYKNFNIKVHIYDNITPMKEIIFYRLNNKSPVEDFLDSLSSKEVQKVLWVLKLIEELNNVSSKYYKKLKNANDIIEVRVSLGNNSFRLLGFEYEDKFVVLTNGFKKKSQKVPKSEIDLAIKRKKEYLT
jgi:phage-related protein